MLIKKYNSIMSQDESSRRRWARGLATFCSLLVLVGFMFYRGFLSFNYENNFKKLDQSNQVANVISAEVAPSPIQTSEDAIKDALVVIKKEYQNFSDSISAVLVPFFTSIEVYQR